MINKKQPAYTRGKYKPRTKDARRGTLKEGSESWLMNRYNISRYEAIKLKKSLEK
jgi:hypothetical protein